ncbi:hypothetical protein ACJZ2D_015797 [Fusarium nematophilum]
MASKRLGQLVLRAYVAQCVLAICTYATWTVTSAYGLSLTTSAFKTYDDSLITKTVTYVIKPDADPTGKPFTTTTSTREVDEGDDLDVVQIFYSQGDFDASDVQTSTAPNEYPIVRYLQEVRYTAPASCPTQFTATTQVVVYIPHEAASQVTPTSITTTSSSKYGEVYTYVTAYLSEGAAPLSTETDDLDQCLDPAAMMTGSAGDPDGDGDDGRPESAACSFFKGCTTLGPWVASVLPSLFVLGFMGL